ncbi:hypothetical protein H2198_010418 [Neophaeococcomyces mojaviensis]|uniref:Uncharacterized protein n=1 Tax=Neophaeococcomyces mojaviensis TaxID=3383035 RepID=A0ACC2ZRR8_9EURO|nr:hypothetical protein H2198_010418 [Knufia sp. JES_112]
MPETNDRDEKVLIPNFALMVSPNGDLLRQEQDSNVLDPTKVKKLDYVKSIWGATSHMQSQNLHCIP